MTGQWCFIPSGRRGELFTAEKKACIKLDPERRIGRIDRKIYGNFIEHLSRCIYGGIYEEGSAPER